jgi:hypothetical protein
MSANDFIVSGSKEYLDYTLYPLIHHLKSHYTSQIHCSWEIFSKATGTLIHRVSILARLNITMPLVVGAVLQ